MAASGDRHMDAQTSRAAIKAFIEQIVLRLEQAASVAKAAQACADAGSTDKAVEIALEVEQPIYEAGTLLNAASFIKRISGD
jgi:hypothetical protein